MAEANFFASVLSNEFGGFARVGQAIEISSRIGQSSLRTEGSGFEVAGYEPHPSGFSEVLNHQDIIKAI